ncbi:MAG: aldo/keto reductase [Blastochloris sp.]|nr:aldo/keto reductase [Blastochloris sp.]
MSSPSFDPQRRNFLKKLGVGALALWGGQTALLKASETSGSKASGSAFPQRKFGRHDFMVSAMSLGGHTLATASDEKESFRIVHEAVDQGMTFMDNSWDYHNGRSEDLMGKALVGRRDKVFLMTKVCNHGSGGKKESLKMLDESLRRLKTDHLDLWQWHAVASMEQVEHGFRPDSVVEALDEAKKQGKTRFIGFTGHTEPDVHLAVLKHQHPFDACQLPLNPIDANADAFQRKVLPELLRQKIAVLAMKTLLGNANPIRDGVLTVPEALRYAFSLPVTTIVSGIKSMEELRQNMDLARNFQPMSAEEMLALETRCRPALEKNSYEPYRKWMTYRDGDSSRYV